MTRKRILFVDDEPNVLQAYRRSLRGSDSDWDLQFESSPTRAWERIGNESFDTIISDVSMPEISGIDLLKQIKLSEATNDIPVIVVTGQSDRDLKQLALDLDASDLLSKPVDPNELVARIRNALRLKDYADRLKNANETLEQRVNERTAQLNASRVDIIWRLAKAAEFRDEETGNHVTRVACYSRLVAQSMGMKPTFCDTVFLAAPLHDIGKIGIPDCILLKPGPLTPDEWRVMRRHCQMGVSILTAPCRFMNGAQLNSAANGDFADLVEPINPVIEMASQIAASHHEKWDGSGYPNGITGEQIPLAARIVAIADVYDALRSRRPYKEPYQIDQALEILAAGAGCHFDPRVVSAFDDCFPEIHCIEQNLSDDSQVGFNFASLQIDSRAHLAASQPATSF